ncbi:MAG: crossover junction endodeoxyribonuclease RuvC [Candidatus Omnitrophica bacterium]|jgi:crossover junction endodeoxyribonuclease RuvC|nr:crossover junction endodeoxyribonuclease RuvC [Candidatus Omnitrophota bacterium]MDD5538090.1 crossover junction endodeoxyribonuclease RuvC [Candidatus Omnitrophota bacterium]
MLILGIDPGLHVTGYGLIEADRHGFTVKRSGFIKTRMKDELPKRLSQIHRELTDILEKYKPNALVLEKLYAHYKHPLTASLLGHARGVICMLAEEKKVAFFEYPATRVKQVTTGHGHASKEQVQKMIEHMFGAARESFGPVDTTDAISLAVTHALTIRAKLL